ncbi:MAG: hypothetical protein R3212_01195 [Xanthomonadales bacterium]|nr:hypothetical protein [Xanthomonadales bacterium]
MKLVLVASLAAVLGMGISGEAEAHGYGPVSGGSFYWADSGYAVGFSYGVPVAAPYYAPRPYAYAPRAYRHAHYHGKHYRKYHRGHGRHHGKGYKKAYRKGYRKGYRHGYRDDWYDD